MQRISSYIAGSGKTIYQKEQYNSKTNEWYIIGDCSNNKAYLKSEVDNHNLKLQYQHETNK